MKPRSIPELAQYIQQQQRRGRSDAVIRNELQRNNWSDTTIDDAYQLIWQQTSGQHYITPDPVAVAQQQAAAGMPSRKKRMIIGLSLIIGVLALFVVAITLLSRSPSTGSDNQQQNTAATSRQDQTAQNQQREKEVDAIAGAVQDYLERNNFAYPARSGQGQGKDDNKLLLCADAACQGANDVSVTLDTYSPSNVQLKAYSGGLAQPKLQEVFIVTTAICNDKEDWIAEPLAEQDPATTVAFLYRTETNSGTKLQCSPL